MARPRRRHATEENILAKLEELETVLFWREFGAIIITLGLSIFTISITLNHITYSIAGFFYAISGVFLLVQSSWLKIFRKQRTVLEKIVHLIPAIIGILIMLFALFFGAFVHV
jgi:hypothetical protein